MDLKKVEKKWQKQWKDTGLYRFDPSSPKPKHYVLEMFSYPSAAKLHVGHWYNYGPSDSYARFKRMQGYNVFQPMGFDAFGLPAENFAIKTGIHPEDSTLKNIRTMEKQLRSIGAMFDWSAEIKTCLPDYYKWTQWIFLQLYQRGLAYRKEAPVNWCPSCATVLANEQAEGGSCERCHSAVVKKNLTQWFFKITAYADELLDSLAALDWPEKTKLMQKNWIGRSVGGEIVFTAKNGTAFKVFTTRADTLLGVSYVVLAPEHPLVEAFTAPAQKQAVAAYTEQCARMEEIERLSTAREKTGVFTGSHVLHPLTGKEIPVYVADYVLATYGTGAVMGVPAHDERDFVFAQKYSLPITRVVRSADGSPDELPYTADGVLTGSGRFDGMTSENARAAIIAALEQEQKGAPRVNTRLRDWLVSRQRYWGTPIPMLYCDACGEVPVPEKDLPVRLPYDVAFTPDGESPLKKSRSFMETVCPRCGKPARRDPDTLDTFVCSSWYFLRYPDNKNKKAAFDTDKINAMLPVDKYIGGAEHACLHLLYARFFTKALRDMGYVNFDEPFTSLVHQGIILGPDGNRMSKSHGNVISPDAYITKYGADIFRLYLMFGFSYTEGGPWNDDGIKAVVRFTDRAERLILKAFQSAQTDDAAPLGKPEKELRRVLNHAIKCVTADVQIFSFNTAIARLMELTNAMAKYESEGGTNAALFRECARALTLMLAPLAPHFAEELWEQTGGGYSVFDQSFPLCDESALVTDEVEIAVQICGKVRTRITLPSGLSQSETDALVRSDARVQAYLEGKPVKKIIVIPDKLVNIVV